MADNTPLKDLMPIKAYEAMKMASAARNAARVEDTTETRLQSDLNALVLRAGYTGREQYEQLKRTLGMDADQARRFELAGMIVQPKQMAFAVAARSCDAPDGPEEVGIGGAKGGGKSLVLLLQAGIDDCMRFPGLKVMYLRYTAKVAKEQLSDIALKVFRRHPEIEQYRDRIDFPNGSRFIIGGFNNDRQALAYAGIECDVLIVEEATQLSEATHEALRGTSRSSKTHPETGVPWRPRRYYSTNPLGIGHAFFKRRFIDNERKRVRWESALLEGRVPRLADKPDPRQKFIFARVEDNRFVNPEYIGVLESYTGAQRQAYREGNWDVSAGAYFGTYSEAAHIRPNFPSSPDSLAHARQLWCSMDFGYNHWNVVHLHADVGDGVVYTVDELCHRRKYPDEIGPDLLVWLEKYGLTPADLKYFLVGTDAFAANGRSRFTIVQEYAKFGLHMSRAENSPGSRVAGAIMLSRRLGAPERDVEPTWFICECCDRLKECLAYLEIDPTNPEDVLKTDTDEEGRGGDDAYDSCRYGLYRPHLTVISGKRRVTDAL